MRKNRIVVSCLALVVSACSGSDPSTSGTGGTASTAGGTTNTSSATVTGNGGAVSVGGSTLVAGTVAGAGGVTTGSTLQSLGGTATGGTTTATTTTGNVATGGATTNGGTSATGGKSATGGTSATGGKSATGGTSATGGKSSTGGTSATGGSTGGTSATGGTTGTAGTAGSCGRTVGTCTAPTVQVTDVSLGIPVTGYGGEGDTAAFPMAIAAMPSGGSRLAWLGTDKKVYVAQLGCDDKLVGTPFSFPAVDFQDIIADDNGGVVLLTRDATNGGTDQCGTGTLCGGTSSPCRTMWMVRFNSTGTVEWETQVTNLSTSLAGYQDGARFIWWYQHHGRLAFSGTNYAAFFGVAITVKNGSCVDIHEGDRLQIVSSSGALVSAGSLAVGMSHAWTSRILWDSRTSKFMASDATDNNCRITIPTGGITIAPSSCDGTLFNGDLVQSTGAGYWNAWSQGNAIKLEHFTTGASDKTISGAGTSQHPHLVSLGASNMLLTWQSGTGIAAQVRNANDAATVGAQFTIAAVADHDYGAWKAYTDGSAAYAATGSNTTSIKIARVLPCN